MSPSHAAESPDPEPAPAPARGPAAAPTRSRRRSGASLPRPTRFGWACTVLLLGLIAANERLPGRDHSLVAVVVTTLGVIWLVGLVWPVIALRLVRLDVLGAPRDATAGGHVPVDIAVRGGIGAVTSLRVGGLGCALRSGRDPGDGPAEPGPAEPTVLSMSGTTRLRVPTPHRGIAGHCVGWIETDAPVGILRCRRAVRLDLPAPVAIAPVPIAARVRLTDVPDSGVDRMASRSPDAGDTVRSVRPYRPGDPAHLVHWPTSAQTGALVVRELEPPSRPGLVLVVEVGDDSPETEDAVAEAAGVALAVLGAGGAVLLCTNEGRREVRAEVHGPREVGRRLAAAVPGAVGPPARTRGSAWPTMRIGP